MAKTNRRQHFSARFYLRNFAEPMFSDKLHVYDLQKRRWKTCTPNGVGWFPYLYSMIDMKGNRTDEFDQFLKLNVEDPAAPAMKKLATGGAIDAKERSAVALFIALTFARSPAVMNGVLAEHLDGLDPAARSESDDLVKQWCHWTEKPYGSKSHGEFLKPSTFGAIWVWSQSLQLRLLQWQWRLVRTTRDRPFVTSDQPVFAQKQDGVQLVTFPVSSEIALIMINGGQFSEARDLTNEAFAMNRQTVARATEFVVCFKDSFPGDNYLTSSGKRA